MRKLIKLFEPNETNFKHNKWILNEVKSCVITETTDGLFYVDLKYVLNDKKNLSNEFKIGRILSIPYRDKGNQLFKIRKRTKNTKNNEVSIYADCIARADLDTNYINGIRIQNLTRKQAVQRVLDNIIDQSRKYTVGNLDINSSSDINNGLDDNGNIINYIDIADVSPLEGLIGDSNSLLSAYGGEITFNNFNIDMIDFIGSNKTFIIKSGKNLKEVEEDINDTDKEFATALIMQSNDGLYLPNNEIILSENYSNYYKKYYKTITCNDVDFSKLIDANSTTEDIENAKQTIYNQLRERARKQFEENHIDIMPLNQKIVFEELAKTEEYKDYIELEQAYIGNKVKVKYKDKIVKEGRIISVKYNVLSDKIEEIEIGKNKVSSIVNIISSTDSKIKNVTNNFTTITKETNSRIDKTAEKLQSSINSVTTTTTELGKKYEDNQSKISQLDNRITTEVSKSITDLDGRVTTNTTAINQMSDKITNAVNKDNMGSLIEQKYDSVAIAIKNQTNSNVVFDQNGQTIKNGNLKIQDSKGANLFEFIQYSNTTSLDLRCGVNFYTGNLSFIFDNDGFAIEASDGGYCLGIDDKGFIMSGGLSVEGKKNCLITTKNYGKREISAYETAEYYFGDLGESIIDNTGRCEVVIEPIFKECINTSITYHVFTQVYEGKINKIERYEDKFIVYGEPNTNFSWELKAKRLGYEKDRLEIGGK